MEDVAEWASPKWNPASQKRSGWSISVMSIRYNHGFHQTVIRESVRDCGVFCRSRVTAAAKAVNQRRASIAALKSCAIPVS